MGNEIIKSRVPAIRGIVKAYTLQLFVNTCSSWEQNINGDPEDRTGIYYNIFLIKMLKRQPDYTAEQGCLSLERIWISVDS